MTKIIRTSTIPLSLNLLLKGQLKFLNRHFEIVAISGEGHDLRVVEQREGITVIPIELQRNISPLKDLISLFKLYKCFKEEKPNIVHSITPKAGLISMLAAYLAGVPIRMHTFTGLIFPTKKGIIKTLLINMDRLLCKVATNIYPEGVGVRNDLKNYRISNKPLHILANGNINGINTSFFDTGNLTNIQRGQYEIEEGDFVFIFVGRLVKDKGINELVSAFRRLSNGYKRSKLLLIGPFEGQLNPLDNDILHEIETNPDIISVGYQEDVRPYLAVSDALAFPSYREGFPNVVMQAGAMGLPSIVSDINGCNEIIKEGENGTIIPPKNTDALYDAMLRFIEDRELVNTLKSNARRMIVERYEQQVVWEALLAEYKRLEERVLNKVQNDVERR